MTSILTMSEFVYLLQVKTRNGDSFHRIQYRITAMVSRCVLGCAPSYLRVLCCPVSVLAARRVLRSAARGEFLVPRAHLAIMQRRAFSIVGPSAWNDLPFEL